MTNGLQFIDCPHCGKRIRSNANECHHCHQAPSSSRQPKRARRDLHSQQDPDEDSNLIDPDDENSHSEAHFSAAGGGWDQTADDFDYEEFLAEEFAQQSGTSPRPRVKLWIWLTAWLLIIVTLVPFVYALLFIR